MTAMAKVDQLPPVAKVGAGEPRRAACLRSISMTASHLGGALPPRAASTRRLQRLLLLVATGVSHAVVAAPSIAQLEALSPAARPVLATHAELSVAVIFPSENTAQLLVFRGASIDARSVTFEFPLVANYGAARVEMIDIPSTSRFTIHMRTRQTCGPGVFDYRFAERGQTWVVSGLDRLEHECSAAGITLSSKASYDFLKGTIVRTELRQRVHQGHSTTHQAFTAFPLASFEAFASRYEPQ